MKLKWKNFRSFRDTDWLEFQPLTVILGRNNTGKSNLYQPLLLLAQTWQSPTSTPALITKGDFVDAGTYQDIAFRHQRLRPTTFSFADLVIPSPPPPEVERRLDRMKPDQIDLTFGIESEGDVALTEFLLADTKGELLLARSRHNSSYSLRGMPVLQMPSDKTANARARRVRRKVFQDHLHNFTFSGDVLETEDFAELSGSEEAFVRFEPAIEWALRYEILMGWVANSLGALLRGVSYVGPLRALPMRWYPLSGARPRSVGKGGGLAAEILFRGRDTKLLADVEEWLARFDLAEKVEFETAAADMFAVMLRRATKSPPMNLADSGMGVSQLLPLIVQGLHAKKGQLLLVEQPEIHLNPTLQARLAELFVSLAKSGRPVVVETHSEHLLLRLRTLIADNAMRSTDVSLFFTEKVKDISRVRRVEIEPDGSIRRGDWPKGFFEESLVEALALSAAKSRRHANAN